MLLCMQREMEIAVGSQFDISKGNKENVGERMTTISYFIAKQQPSALGSRRKAEIHKSLKLCHILKLNIQLEGLPFTPRQCN